MVTGPVAVLRKVALDEDGVRDNNDRITLLIAITLGQCGLSTFLQRSGDGALRQLTGHEKRTTEDQLVLRDAPMHRHTARAQRKQIAPYASFGATTLVAMDTVLVVSHRRIPTCRC